MRLSDPLPLFTNFLTEMPRIIPGHIALFTAVHNISKKKLSRTYASLRIMYNFHSRNSNLNMSPLSLLNLFCK